MVNLEGQSGQNDSNIVSIGPVIRLIFEELAQNFTLHIKAIQTFPTKNHDKIQVSHRVYNDATADIFVDLFQ